MHTVPHALAAAPSPPPPACCLLSTPRCPRPLSGVAEARSLLSPGAPVLAHYDDPRDKTERWYDALVVGVAPPPAAEGGDDGERPGVLWL